MGSMTNQGLRTYKSSRKTDARENILNWCSREYTRPRRRPYDRWDYVFCRTLGCGRKLASQQLIDIIYCDGPKIKNKQASLKISREGKDNVN